MPLGDLLEKLGRPAGTTPGKELGIWWRLVYRGGLVTTEPWEQASIRVAARGAIALQLVSSPDTPAGSGLMHIPLDSGERPIFYRVRSMGMNTAEAGAQLDTIVYGKGREVEKRWNSETRMRDITAFDGTLWCVIPGVVGLEQPVPQRWIDLTMIDLQVA